MQSCPDAIAYIRGNDRFPGLSGEVRFYQKQHFVRIVADIRGLPPSSSGFFGFHIHEGTDCGGSDFSNTGGHYNPAQVPHPNHAGDLPPLLLCQGDARLCVATDRFRVCQIIGRTVVIHSESDDFHTQPAGNAGVKIACGVIRPGSTPGRR